MAILGFSSNKSEAASEDPTEMNAKYRARRALGDEYNRWYLPSPAAMLTFADVDGDDFKRATSEKCI